MTDSTIIVVILAIVVLTNMTLAAFIAMRGLNRLTYAIFGAIALCTGLWGAAIIGFYLPELALDFKWVTATHFLAITIALLFLYFSYFFPNRVITRKVAYLTPLVPYAVILVQLFLMEGIVGQTTGNEYEIIPSGYIFYSIVLSAYFAFGYYFLWRQRTLAPEPETKHQVGYVLWGSILSSSLAIIPNLVMPYLGEYSLTWLGPIFTVILVTSIFIAIVRYQLFNIKAILAEITVIVILILLTAELFLSRSTPEAILKGAIFVIVCGVSYFLVKSVHAEIAQREKIERLAADLERANTRLHDLDKQKTEFVSFATHQLRSPLTAIRGYTSLILEGDMGEVSPPVREALGVIAQSSETLTNVVNDYLNISRIELGSMRYDFQLMDLKTMVTEALAELKPNFERAGVGQTFSCDESKSYRVNIDPDKFKQVVVNIIDNSMKYSPKGTVNVSLEHDDEKRVVRFKVSDNGVGMSEATLSKIFAKFSRADNANKINIRGTGLGLFVAKEIVTAHKGRIWAESDGEGKGSRFFVELGAA